MAKYVFEGERRFCSLILVETIKFGPFHFSVFKPGKLLLGGFL